ncbi:MAG: TIGR00730 family Rossman fold protein [Patescibacteria group bacterium]
MAKKTKPSKKVLKPRPLSDEGERRMNFNQAQKREGTKRYHEWLNPSSLTGQPMPEQLQTFTEDPNWRIFRIMAEFIEGYQFLDKFHGEVSIFGSARAPETDPFYRAARTLGCMLGKAGYTVITGGGPGIMEAANRGAFEAGGESVGLDIELSTEQRRNQYVTRAVGFHYFFTRKVMLSAAAQAYVFMPGGFGTLDEMTEMVTLVQTGKIPRDVPIILFGKKFWRPFIAWVRDVVLKKEKYIKKDDLALLHVVDTPKQAFDIIHKTHERPYGSKQNLMPTPPKVQMVKKKKKSVSR